GRRAAQWTPRPEPGHSDGTSPASLTVPRWGPAWPLGLRAWGRTAWTRWPKRAPRARPGARRLDSTPRPQPVGTSGRARLDSNRTDIESNRFNGRGGRSPGPRPRWVGSGVRRPPPGGRGA